ncbi:MAG: hypothetical protein M3O70_20260, partial [Actinomycetota bacterium]|nr:hypothetical protein [Actinomycetota bacterium]
MLATVIIVGFVGFVGVPLIYAWAAHSGAGDRWESKAAWAAEHLRLALWVRSFMSVALVLIVLSVVTAIWHVAFPPGPAVSAWFLLALGIGYGLFLRLTIAITMWGARHLHRGRNDLHRPAFVAAQAADVTGLLFFVFAT